MLTEEGVVLRDLNREAFGVEDKLADRGGAIVFTTFYSVASIAGQSTNKIKTLIKWAHWVTEELLISRSYNRYSLKF